MRFTVVRRYRTSPRLCKPVLSYGCHDIQYTDTEHNSFMVTFSNMLVGTTLSITILSIMTFSIKVKQKFCLIEFCNFSLSLIVSSITARKSNWRGRFSTIDLLLLTSLDQLLLKLKTLFTFLTGYPNEEVNSTEPSLQLVFPDYSNAPSCGVNYNHHLQS